MLIYSIGIDTLEWLDMVQYKHKTEYILTKLNDSIRNDKILFSCTVRLSIYLSHYSRIEVIDQTTKLCSRTILE